MADDQATNDESGAEQAGTPASDAEQAELISPQKSDEKGKTNSSANDGNEADNRFLNKLDLNQWLTLAVAFVETCASVQSCRNSADTSALTNAVGALTDVADESSRQADATGDEASALANQSTVFSNELIEMRRQSSGIQRQASIAQQARVDATRPLIEALGISFLDDPINSQANHAGTLFVANVGGSPALVKSGYYFKTGALHISKADQQYFGKNLSCQKVFDGRFTIFPKTVAPFVYDVRVPAKNITNAVLRKETAVAIEGCLIYPVGSIIKKTEYCYIVAGKGVYPKLGSRLCADGNFAN